MIIKIKLLNHEQFSIAVQPNDNISLVKHRIAQFSHVNDTDVKYVIYNQENLQDAMTLLSYDIDENSILVAVILQEGQSIRDIIGAYDDSEYEEDHEEKESPKKSNKEESDEENEEYIDENNPFAQITQEDNHVVNEFVAMGFDRALVINNYFSCGKNASLTLDILLNNT